MPDVESSISRWKTSGGSERANFQQFAIELTQLLEVPAPKPATADAQADDYRFERPVTFIHTGAQSRGFIDLYRRGCFIMEAKQGTANTTADEAQPTLLAPAPTQQRQGRGVRGSKRWDDTRRFNRVRTASVRPLLESLTALGQARVIEGERFAR